MKNNLRLILAIKKMKVADVHKKTKISKTTLINLYYERTKNPDMQTIVKLCKCLDVTPNELLGVEPIKEISAL